MNSEISTEIIQHRKNQIEHLLNIPEHEWGKQFVERQQLKAPDLKLPDNMWQKQLKDFEEELKY